MAEVNSKWDAYTLTGFVSKPSDARPSRNLQTFFVNGRPVRSRLLIAALEEAYRNQIMVGKFPACVLHLTLPAGAVDVNVHPAKTEVKFLNEKAVFDCVHYGVRGALNKAPDRPQVQFERRPQPVAAPAPEHKVPQKKESFFRTMTAEEYKTFSQVTAKAPQPSPLAAAAVAKAVERTAAETVQEEIILPAPKLPEERPAVPETPKPELPEAPQQQEIAAMPQQIPWRMVGELYNSYILVEQGEDAFLIDKHAAHERILFEKLKKNQEAISTQNLLTPVSCRLSPDAIALLLENTELLTGLGFEVEEFGEGTLLIRGIPMDLDPEDGAEALENIAEDLRNGRKEDRSQVRDTLLHTVACKAAIKAGWKTSPQELQILATQVMAREDLKHCPHGRPICITLSKKQLEKQFKRS
jgi:DNA mismatch repair protein MutL